MVAPLSPYWPSGQQQAEQQNLFDVLIAKCMQSSGFNYPTLVFNPVNYGLDPDNGEFYVFGATSVAVASKYGYSQTDLNDYDPHTASGAKIPDRAHMPEAEPALAS